MLRVCTAGPDRAGDVAASMPTSSAMRRERSSCQGSVTKTTPTRYESAHCGPGRAEAGEGVAADPNGRHVTARDALADQVVAARGGLREPVTRSSTADRDHVRRNARLVETDGVVEPGPEDGAGPAVELARTEHHDRVRVRVVVLPSGVPDPKRRDADDDDDDNDERNDRAEEPAQTGSEPGEWRQRLSLPSVSMAARPPSRRATGTRNGEHDT